MKIQLAQQFNYTMATMEGKNNYATAETSPFETSKKKIYIYIYIYISITQDESPE